MGGLGSSRSKMPHVGWRKAMISPEFSPNSFCHAAQFRMADGNPVVPFPNTTTTKLMRIERRDLSLNRWLGQLPWSAWFRLAT